MLLAKACPAPWRHFPNLRAEVFFSLPRYCSRICSVMPLIVLPLQLYQSSVRVCPSYPPSGTSLTPSTDVLWSPLPSVPWHFSSEVFALLPLFASSEVAASLFSFRLTSTPCVSEHWHFSIHCYPRAGLGSSRACATFSRHTLLSTS